MGGSSRVVSSALPGLPDRDLIVESVDVLPLRLRLNAPFVVAGGRRTHIETVLVRLRADDGSIGWGEAAPDEEVTGESVAESERVLRDLVAPEMVGLDLSDPDATEAFVDGCAPTAPAARAAVDIAVHDLIARRGGVPLWRYLVGVASGEAAFDDGSAPPLSISRVVSMAAPADMAAAARRHVEAGVSTVKLKVGGPQGWSLDVERVAAVRAAVGPDVGIKVDVNQGWPTVDVAVAALERIARSRPLFVEQPIDRRDLEGLAEMRRRVPEVRVMADEAVRGADDVDRIVGLGAADLVNLKIMRIGGLRATLAAAERAAAGIGVQIGTMLESSVGSAAGLHLAAALSSLADGALAGVEMGGPLMLAEDVSDLALCYDGETVALPTGPGLGVDPVLPS